MLCVLANFLTRGVHGSVAHFHFGGIIGVGADAYLSSLEGAREHLRFVCAKGIFSGFDLMVNGLNSTMHVARHVTDSLLRRNNAPSGQGSYVTTLKHFNLSALMAESRAWPAERCLRWAGLMERRDDGGTGTSTRRGPPPEANDACEPFCPFVPMPMPMPVPQGWL